MEHVCRSALTFFVHSTLLSCIIISIEFVFIIIMPLCVVVVFSSFARANLSDISLLFDSPLIYAGTFAHNKFRKLKLFVSLHLPCFHLFLRSFLPDFMEDTFFSLFQRAHNVRILFHLMRRVPLAF